MRILAATIAALAVLTTTSAAAATTRGAAETKARKAANHYTNSHYGIGFAESDGWKMWHATCRSRSPSGWTCKVSMNGGQCSGSVKLTRTLIPFAHRIGCGE